MLILGSCVMRRALAPGAAPGSRHRALSGLSGPIIIVAVRVRPMHVVVAPSQHLVVVRELAFCQARDRNLLFHFVCNQRALDEVQVVELVLFECDSLWERKGREK